MINFKTNSTCVLQDIKHAELLGLVWKGCGLTSVHKAGAPSRRLYGCGRGGDSASVMQDFV